jgi:hypothetical protein
MDGSSVAVTEEDLGILNRCNLSFYPQYGLIRCLLCENAKGMHTGVMTKTFREHMRIAHEVSLESGDVQHILSKFWLPNCPYLQRTRLVLPAIDFLPVFAGYGCQECPFFTTYKRSLRAHYKAKHVDLTIPEMDLLACSLQSLTPEPIRRYFSVDAIPRPPPVTIAQNSSLQQSLIQSWNRPLVQPQTIPAQVPRVLVNMCWTADLFGEHRQYLEECPAHEEDDPLVWWNLGALDQYFTLAMNRIEEVDMAVRIKLKDEARGFRPHQQMSTVKRYSSTMARFVLFALKCNSLEDQCPILIEEPIKASLNRLEQRLLRPEEHDEDGMWEKALYAFLFQVYFSRPPSFSSCHLIPSFIRLECTTADGNARPIDDITHCCAIVNIFFIPTLILPFCRSSTCIASLPQFC